MPADPSSKTRVALAFLFLFVVLVVGGYLVRDLRKLQESVADRERQTALQGVIDPEQLSEALKQYPSNKFLQLMAMATKAANDSNVAIEKLSNEVEPASISKSGNLGGASRSDLEALRRDLKTADTNATTFLPRYTALLKAERDSVERYARSLGVGPDTTSKLLDNIDKRHAEIAALTSKMLSARAESYRAYDNLVGLIIAEFGTYKVINGQLIFPLQRTVDRYNVAANAVTVAAKRVAELGEERKAMLKSQQERWAQFVKSMRS
jgi:hypothetical protein